jgi:hypothetical protein
MLLQGNRLKEEPPPLTPPHKGEGDFVAAMLRKTVDDWRLAEMPANPLPLVGRG